MLVKHILILGMLAMGFWYNGLMRVGPMLSSNSGPAQALARFRQYSNLMSITGVLVLLLTAISQAQ
jgi:putative copper export protein